MAVTDLIAHVSLATLCGATFAVAARYSTFLQLPAAQIAHQMAEVHGDGSATLYSDERDVNLVSYC